MRYDKPKSNKETKAYKLKRTPIKRKPLRNTSKAISKRNSQMKKFYTFAKKIWDSAKDKETGLVKCENCPAELGYDFDPKIHGICISHIKSKGAFPELYYEPLNANVLCRDCHYEFEFGNRTGMKIWPEIEKRLEQITKKSKYFRN